MSKILIIAFLGLPLLSISQLPVVELPGSHVRNIHSTKVGQDYQLHIQLPQDHDKAGKRFPVIYLMDSQWDFPLVRSIIGQQYYDGFIPQVILVGISWGGTEPNYDSLRARDYTPTNELPLKQSGGAKNFISFIKNELVPFIETNYKADPALRIIMGCSFGGLVSLYSLFTEPELFHSYVVASPAYEWDAEVISTYENLYFERKNKPAARLFMTIGGVERNVPGYIKFHKHLESRKYANMKLRSLVLENTGHSGTKSETYSRGLQFIFERKKLKLDIDTLKEYVGKYVSTGGGVYEIRLNGESLSLFTGPSNRYILYADSKTEFYATSEFLNLQFQKGQGTTMTVLLSRFGGSELLNRVD